MPKECNLWQALGTMDANEAARLLIKQNRVPEAKQKLDTFIQIAPNSDRAVIAKDTFDGNWHEDLIYGIVRKKRKIL